jgi:hypothetical protein
VLSGDLSAPVPPGRGASERVMLRVGRSHRSSLEALRHGLCAVDWYELANSVVVITSPGPKSQSVAGRGRPNCSASTSTTPKPLPAGREDEAVCGAEVAGGVGRIPREAHDVAQAQLAGRISKQLLVWPRANQCQAHFWQLRAGDG